MTLPNGQVALWLLADASADSARQAGMAKMKPSPSIGRAKISLR